MINNITSMLSDIFFIVQGILRQIRMSAQVDERSFVTI